MPGAGGRGLGAGVDPALPLPLPPPPPLASALPSSPACSRGILQSRPWPTQIQQCAPNPTAQMVKGFLSLHWRPWPSPLPLHDCTVSLLWPEGLNPLLLRAADVRPAHGFLSARAVLSCRPDPVHTVPPLRGPGLEFHAPGAHQPAASESTGASMPSAESTLPEVTPQ